MPYNITMKRALRHSLGLIVMIIGLSLSLCADPMQLLTPEETLKTLETLKPYAIKIGHGPKEVHSFIDPYCELSQMYVKFVYEREETMLEKYTIYLYLYELPSKHSAAMIETLLESRMPETMLKAVMLSHQDVPLESSGDAEDAVAAISEAAKQIGVFKRPYIIINGKVK